MLGIASRILIAKKELVGYQPENDSNPTVTVEE